MMKLPKEVIKEIANRARAARLEAGLTQETLAEHSGVSFGSIKRFENTGKISLESLLKVAFTLNALEDFDGLFKGLPVTQFTSIDAMLKSAKKTKKRARK